MGPTCWVDGPERRGTGVIFWDAQWPLSEQAWDFSSPPPGADSFAVTTRAEASWMRPLPVIEE